MTKETKNINFVNKNDLLLSFLKKYYKKKDNFSKIVKILNNEAKISLRIIDWFVTNYSKKNNIIYEICIDDNNLKYYLNDEITNDLTNTSLELKTHKLYKQFIVFLNYKSQLKAYSKKQFDPFCRRERIQFSINDSSDKIVTTIGQLNFFKWAIDNLIIDYINDNIDIIDNDMNSSISTSNNLSKKKKRKRRSRNKESLKASKKNEKNTPAKNTAPKNTLVKKPSTKKVPKKKNNTKRKKRNELSISASRGLNKHNVRTILEFD